MNLKPLEALRPEHRHQRQRDQESAERKNVRDPADGVLVLLWMNRSRSAPTSGVNRMIESMWFCMNSSQLSAQLQLELQR